MSWTNMILFGLAGCAATLLVAMCVLLARRVLRQVGGEPAYAADVISKITEGDLSVRVETRTGDDSSLLHAMKLMQQDLHTRVSQIRQSAQSISGASGEIAAGNADLSQRTEEQASSLEETASSMEELTSTVKQSADNARQANQLAAGGSQIAVKGGAGAGESGGGVQADGRGPRGGGHASARAGFRIAARPGATRT